MCSPTKPFLPLILSLSLLFVACDRQAPLVPDNGQAERGVGAVVLQAAEQATSTDEFFLQVYKRVPGFAGLTYEGGVPTAYLTQSEQAAPAHAALELFLQQQGKADRGFRVRPATYSWGQLYAWRMKARALFSLPQLTALGVSERRNRVVIGIAPGSDPTNVRKHLEDLGIPDAAVEIREQRAVPALSHVTDRNRPVMGGLQIWATGIDTTCTAGVNMYWDGMRTMMTAAHCLTPIDQNSNQTVYQPLSGSGRRIGVEIADPSPITCSDTLPFHSICLNSDAALVLYDDSVAWSFGHIARTTWSDQYTGSKTIDPVQSRFWITNTQNFVISGDTLNKIGKTTGWTQDTAADVCFDQAEADTTVTVIVKCVSTVSAGAGPGDSGSPVFKLTSNGKVTLLGILWGGFSQGPFYFSPVGQIGLDYGPYLDVDTVAPTLPSGLSISGPTRIRPGATCLWTGNVTGGTTPYTYSWTNDGFTVSDTDSYRGGKLDGETGSSFSLKFVVINDAGSSSTQITVQEDSTALICRN